MPENTIEVELDTPIQAHGETVTKLILHEPAVDEFEAMDRGTGELNKAHHLIAACAKIPYSSLRMLSGSDYRRVMDAFIASGFTVGGSSPSESGEESPRTGPTPSA